jgi:DNA-binding ferritin-like protein
MLTDLYCLSVVLNNNFHHVHLHSKGILFDTLHGIAGDYYDKMSGDTDTLAELALEQDEEAPNACVAASKINANVFSETSYTLESGLLAMSKDIQIFIDELEKNKKESYDSDIVNYLDELSRYWKKELNYKMKQRLS